MEFYKEAKTNEYGTTASDYFSVKKFEIKLFNFQSLSTFFEKK